MEEKYNKKELKEAVFKIKKLWSECEYLLNNRSISKYGDDLLNITKRESKEHDRFRGQSITRNITIGTEARYFALKRLLETVFGFENHLKLEDYHHTQKSCFMAYSLAFEFRDLIKEKITIEQAKYICSLDYCRMI